MFDGLVLEISVVVFNETLHATLYKYEFVFIPSGVFVDTLSAEDSPEESILSDPNMMKIMIASESSEDASGDASG